MKIYKLLIKNIDNIKFRKQHINNTFRNEANNILRNFVLNSSELKRYKYFSEPSIVSDWCHSRRNRWSDLVDPDKEMTILNYNNVRDHSKKELIKSVRNYLGNGYVGINQLLRFNSSMGFYRDLLEKNITNIDYLFNNYKFDDCVIAYRWLRTSSFTAMVNTDLSNVVFGTTFVEEGYSSCSLSLSYNHYERDNTVDEGIIVLVIKINKGSRAIDTCALNVITNESEITIGRNTTYIIEECIYSKGENRIYLVDILS